MFKQSIVFVVFCLFLSCYCHDILRDEYFLEYFDVENFDGIPAQGVMLGDSEYNFKEPPVGFGENDMFSNYGNSKIYSGEQSALYYFNFGSPIGNDCSVCQSEVYASSTKANYGNTEFWNDGKASWMDVLPQGSVVQEATVLAKGLYGCGYGNTASNVSVSLNGAVESLPQIRNGGCSCDDCTNELYKFDFYEGGIPGYRVGESNEIQFIIHKGGITISRVYILLKWTPPQPFVVATMLSQEDYQSGCPVCGSNYFSSSLYPSCWTPYLGFIDPLPCEDVVVEKTSVVVYGLWGCGGARYFDDDDEFERSATVTIELSGGYQHTFTASSPCACQECTPVSFEIDGLWKGYKKDGINIVHIEVTKGAIELSKINILFFLENPDVCNSNPSNTPTPSNSPQPSPIPNSPSPSPSPSPTPSPIVSAGCNSAKDCGYPKGFCNSTSHECECFFPYYGDHCQYLNCPQNCSYHGTCNKNNGNCQCFTNYYGCDCSGEIFQCPNNCSDHGTCDHFTGTCLCNQPYAGPDCSQGGKTCPSNCTEPSHGVCNTFTGECSCFAPWSGPSCDTKNLTCPNNCYNRGVCNHQTGICKCDPGYVGPECGGYSCQYNCSNHGRCNYYSGSCYCDPGYYGCYCESHNAALAQSASKGFVSYLPGNPDDPLTWPLIDNNNKFLCKNRCSGNGVCTESGCMCNAGYVGIDCSQKSNIKIN
eukprot:TRINITY_DN685_c4_g1_i1.p1 TRINITY_DN685_c4_g1~~TRINITY_DN685_c4_g1_i1.p1  ORF type:complete len:704 (-),score=242.68 TRINITY_DN685_c4_g1_i1:103-2214(-)